MTSLGNFGNNELIHDPMDDVDEDDYQKMNGRFNEQTVSPMRKCTICAFFISAHDDVDLKQASEIGATMLLEKPFVLMIESGAKVPEPLGLLARAIIFDFDPTSRLKMIELSKIIQDLEEEYDHGER